MLGALIALCSCEDKYYADGGTLSHYPFYMVLSEDSYSAPSAAASEKKIYVSSYQTPWQVTNSLSWVSVTPMDNLSTGDETIQTITVQANTTNGDEKRIGLLEYTASNGDMSKQVYFSVSQPGAIPTATVSVDELHFSASESSQQFQVTEANCTWKVTASSSFITATQNGNMVSVTVTKNPGSVTRSGTVYILRASDGYRIETVQITQDPVQVYPVSGEVTVPPAGGVAMLQFEVDDAWTASCSASWISLGATYGEAGTHTLRIEAAANPNTYQRSTSLILNAASGASTTVKIYQDYQKFAVYPRTFYFDVKGETKTMEVTSDGAWEIVDIPEWLQFTPQSGTGNKSVQVTALRNENGLSRTASPEIRLTNSPTRKIVLTTTQYSAEMTLGKDTLEFDYAGGSLSLELKSDANWTASTDADWLTVSPTSGTEDETLTVTAARNSTGAERTGHITAQMGDETRVVLVRQKSSVITVDQQSLAFEMEGGTLNIGISGNTSWKASLSAGSDWLTLSTTEGKGAVSLDVQAQANHSEQSRTAKVTITTDNERTFEIAVSQKSCFLELSANEVNFYANGGTSDPIEVSTNWQYNVTTSENWIAIQPGDHTFTVTVTENPGAAQRTGQVKVVMTGLTGAATEHLLTVRQAEPGGSLIIGEYPADSDIDGGTAGTSGSLDLDSYAPDTELRGSQSAFRNLRVRVFKARQSISK